MKVANIHSSHRGWIGIDFDGSLAVYNGDFTKLGEPIPEMVERVKHLIEKNEHDVKIMTARVWFPESQDKSYSDAEFYERKHQAFDQRKLIQDWCLKHIGKILPVTCIKDPWMVCLYDDRAVRVLKNKGTLCCDHDTAEETIAA